MLSGAANQQISFIGSLQHRAIVVFFSHFYRACIDAMLSERIIWGISSNGRVLAHHARGNWIDASISPELILNAYQLLDTVLQGEV